MKASDENPFGPPTGYAIYLEWDRDKRETSDVLDISPEVQINPLAFLTHELKLLHTKIEPELVTRFFGMKN